MQVTLLSWPWYFLKMDKSQGLGNTDKQGECRPQGPLSCSLQRHQSVTLFGARSVVLPASQHFKLKKPISQAWLSLSGSRIKTTITGPFWINTLLASFARQRQRFWQPWRMRPFFLRRETGISVLFGERKEVRQAARGGERGAERPREKDCWRERERERVRDGHRKWKRTNISPEVCVDTRTLHPLFI